MDRVLLKMIDIQIPPKVRQGQVRQSGHRVYATLAKRVTPTDASCSQPASFEHPVLLDCLEAILGTGGGKTTQCRHVRGNGGLVEPYQTQYDPLHFDALLIRFASCTLARDRVLRSKPLTAECNC